jgi:nicotinamidase-related amidase
MSPAGSWLLLIDLQRIFGEPPSPWAAPDFAPAAAGADRLREAFGDRVAVTRFLPHTPPTGAWVSYYQQWPFAVDPASADLYDLVPPFERVPLRVDRAAFGKWDAETADLLDHPAEIVLAGVSTDCCVLSTALAAADAGVQVRVVTDACAGASEADHQRALDAMALYAPLIELTTIAEVLAAP